MARGNPWWIGMVSVFATACILEVGGGEREWSFVAPPEARVEIANGDIDARSSFDNTFTARWDGGGLGDNANPDVFELSNGAVLIDADGGIAGGGSMDLDVPAGTDLELVVDRGSIDVHLDEPTNLFACAGAGKVAIAVPPGPYRLDIDTGVASVDQGIVNDPSGPYTIEVCVGAGEVELRTL